MGVIDDVMVVIDNVNDVDDVMVAIDDVNDVDDMMVVIDDMEVFNKAIIWKNNDR